MNHRCEARKGCDDLRASREERKKNILDALSHALLPFPSRHFTSSSLLSSLRFFSFLFFIFDLPFLLPITPGVTTNNPICLSFIAPSIGPPSRVSRGFPFLRLLHMTSRRTTAFPPPLAALDFTQATETSHPRPHCPVDTVTSAQAPDIPGGSVPPSDSKHRSPEPICFGWPLPLKPARSDLQRRLLPKV